MAVSTDLHERMARVEEAVERLTEELRFMRGQLWAIIGGMFTIGGGIIIALIMLLARVWQ